MANKPDLISRWKSILDSRVIGHDQIKRILFFVLVGQLFYDKVRIQFGNSEKTLKMHLFFIAPSRTGKGELMNVFSEIAKKLKLRTNEVTEFTTAALYGRIDERQRQTNRRAIRNAITNEQDPDDLILPDDTIPGLADESNSDFLIMREAEAIFSNTNHHVNLLRVMQELMDEKGEAQKVLADGSITIKSRFSFIGTTVPPSFQTSGKGDLLQEILSKGFFQRCYIHVSFFDLEKRRLHHREILELYSMKKLESKDNFNQLVDEFCEDLQLVKDSLGTGEILYLKLEEKTIELLQKKVDSTIENLSKSISGTVLDSVSSFTNIVIELLIKTGAVRCLLRGGTAISVKDITQEKGLVAGMLESVIINLANKSEGGRVDSKLKQMAKTIPAEWTNATTLKEYISSKFGIGKNKAHTIIEDLYRSNLTERQIKGNEKLYKRKDI